MTRTAAVVSLGRDLSLEEPTQRSSAERIWMMTYADDRTNTRVFQKNVNFQTYGGINRGIHGFIQYGPEDLDAAFKEKNQKILKEKPWVGLALWKPYVILKTLNDIAKEGDCVLWADSGIALQKDVSFMQQEFGSNDLLVHPDVDGFQLRHQCRQAAWLHAGLNANILDSDRNAESVWTGLLWVRNTQRARAFIKRWLHFTETEEIVRTKPTKKEKLHPDWRTHCSDQSSLNISLYKELLDVAEEDRMRWRFLDRVTSRKTSAKERFGFYYFWHHRHPRQAGESLLKNLPPI